MKTRRLATFLVMACLLIVLANQTAFAATRIVKFIVPACQ
jgi:hypothetical protein